jgi:uncharacterized glyoxalase superfamily protein PhnB
MVNLENQISKIAAAQADSAALLKSISRTSPAPSQPPTAPTLTTGTEATSAVFLSGMSALSKDLTGSIVSAYSTVNDKADETIKFYKDALETARSEKTTTTEKNEELRNELMKTQQIAAAANAKAEALTSAIEEIRKQNRMLFNLSESLRMEKNELMNTALRALTVKKEKRVAPA